jgi:hypothetical protein
MVFWLPGAPEFWLTFALLQLLWRASILPCPASVERRDFHGRVCALLHAVTCSALAMRSLPGASSGDDTMIDLGITSLTITIGYLMHDIVVITTIGSDAYVPLIAHHTVSAMAAFGATIGERHAVWYGCILQCTESTVPFQFTTWLLERQGMRTTRAYCVARWLQLLVWLVMRVCLVLAFIYLVVRDWGTFSGFSKALGWLAGPPLLLFNVAGLFKVILPGLPWAPRKQM